MKNIVMEIREIKSDFFVNVEPAIDNSSLDLNLHFSEPHQEMVIQTKPLFELPSLELVTPGIRGEQGKTGAAPKHEWIEQTSLRFANPDGTWGETIDIKNKNYEFLENKPSIESVPLEGNKTFGDLGMESIPIAEITKML